MNDLALNIGLVVLFVLIGGVFAATEMALVTLRESQLTRLEARGERGRKVAELARNPNTFLSAVQIGVTVAGFLSAAYGATSLSAYVAPRLVDLGLPEGLSQTLSLIVLTLLIAYLSLVFGELAPKRLAIQRASAFSLLVVPVLGRFATLMRPVIWLLSVSTNAVVRLVGGDPDKTGEEMSEEELRDLVIGHESLPREQRKMLDDLLTLRGRQVTQVMQPRRDVVAFPGTALVTTAAQQIREQPFSRYPVTGESIDDITGFVHVRDLFDAATAPDAAGRDLASVQREIAFIPGTNGVLATLTDLRDRGLHIAVVLDEYGGTEGIVTLEDLIEEVVGEISDEYDRPAEGGGDPDDHTLDVEGGLNLQEFEEVTGLALPHGPYDTAAGYVIARLGRLPAEGDVVEVADADGVSIEVARIVDRRVTGLLVRTGPPTD